MRILIAHAFYRVPGGEDRYVNQQLDLLSRGHTVELLAEKNEELTPGIATAGRMIFSPRTKKRVTGAIRAFGPDVIHVHNAYPALGPAVHLAAQEQAIPLVMTVHNFRLRCPNGLMFTEGLPCRRCEKGVYVNAVIHRCFPDRKQAAGYAVSLWLHRFLLRLERKVSLFIAPSNFMKERLVEGGLPENKVDVIRNFVTVHPKQQLQVGGSGIYVGRLSIEKGLELLITALQVAGDPPFRIVGDGPARNQLEDLSKEMGLENLAFLGRLPPDQVDALLRQARFFVMPSLCEENCPLSVLEAMAAGLPLLVSGLGGLVELAAEGAGVVFRPGNPLDLAAKLRTLIEDDELCRRAGKRAMSLAENEFRPDSHLAQLEAAYAKAIATHNSKLRRH